MIGKAMNQLPAADGIETVGLLRPTHRLVAGLGFESGGHPTQAYSAGDLYALPFWLPEPATLKTIRLESVTVAAAAGNKARLGLARWQQGGADSPTYQGGTVDIDSTGAKTLDCSADSLRLAAGWHAVLLLLQAGITAEVILSYGEMAAFFLCHTAPLGTYASNALMKAAVAWGPFPDPLPAWTYQNSPKPPLVYVEVTP